MKYIISTLRLLIFLCGGVLLLSLALILLKRFGFFQSFFKIIFPGDQGALGLFIIDFYVLVIGMLFAIVYFLLRRKA